MPILSELAPSQNTKNALTTAAVPQLLQTPPHELVLPPVLVPKLQLEKPPKTTSIPYSTSHMDPLPSTSTDYKTEPLSLEMFNHAATDLNEKGVINLKRYKKYLHQPQHQNKMDPAFMFGHLDLDNRFAMEGLNMAFAAELHHEGKPLPRALYLDVMVEKNTKTY